MKRNQYDFTFEDNFGRELQVTLANLRTMLLAKNKAYGDSALDPLRILSKASAEEQLLVRLDDKLSRLTRGAEAGEDAVNDILGYFALLKILRTREESSSKSGRRRPRNPQGAFALDLSDILHAMYLALVRKSKIIRNSSERQILVRIGSLILRCASRSAATAPDSLINDLISEFLLLTMRRTATGATTALRLRNPRAADRRQRASKSAAAGRRRNTASRRSPSP